MTLVEVVAALVLAASVLGTALVAYGRSLRQERLARDRLDAVAVADELLTQWHAPGATIPRPDQQRLQPVTGPVEAHEGWQWRISALPAGARSSQTDRFTVTRYQLEIVAEKTDQHAERSLVSVELVGAMVPAAGPGVRVAR